MTADMFCVWLFSSQTCESLFRSSGSITSTLSTVVNFSIKEFIERIDRIMFVNHVLNDLEEHFIFPGEEEETKIKRYTTRI